MKKIIVTTRQAESLKELMDRGLAYTDDFLESLVDGILITFWPLTVLIYFLFDA